MKHYLLSLSLLFASLCLYAQQQMDLEFSLSDYQVTVSGGIATITTSLDCTSAGTPAFPALPYFPLRIDVPKHVSSVPYTVTFDKTLLQSNVKVTANPGVATTNDEVLESYPYAQTEVSNPVYNGGVVHTSDGRYLYLKVTPFLYVGDSLFFVPYVHISIPEFPAAPSMDPSAPSVTDTIDYLVITSASLAEAFDSLLEWKELKGLNTKLEVVERISTKYSGNDTQEKIKRCIYDYHTNHATKFVLLGGDDTVVPARYCPINGGDDDTPADLYYASFGGNFCWDANGNGIYGEIKDGVSFNPSIYLSRLPVREEMEVMKFTTKLLRYERDADPKAAEKLFMTGYLKDPFNGMGVPPSAESFNDSLFNKYIASHWDGEKYYLYENSCNLPDSSTKTISCANLISEINRGYNLVHECSHGNTDRWILQSIDYTTANAQAQTNSHPSVIVTNSCFTNSFDSEPCLSESLIRNPNGGAIAYFGSSRQGYKEQYNVYTHSFCYDGSFFETLLTGKPLAAPYSFSAVAAQAKYDHSLEAYTTNSYDRWLQFSINPIGDPEMQIYTAAPRYFQDTPQDDDGGFIWFLTYIPVQKIRVNLPTSGCTVVAKYKNGTKQIFRNVNHADIDCSDTCDVAIFKHNYIPKIYRNLYMERPGSSPFPIHLNVKKTGQNITDVYLTHDSGNNTELLVNDSDIPNGWSLNVINTMSGENVFSDALTEAYCVINTSGWPSGVYAIHGIVNNEVLTQKICIKK